MQILHHPCMLALRGLIVPGCAPPNFCNSAQSLHAHSIQTLCLSIKLLLSFLHYFASYKVYNQMYFWRTLRQRQAERPTPLASGVAPSAGPSVMLKAWRTELLHLNCHSRPMSEMFFSFTGCLKIVKQLTELDWMHWVRFVEVSKGKKARIRRGWLAGHDNIRWAEPQA